MLAIIENNPTIPAVYPITPIGFGPSNLATKIRPISWRILVIKFEYTCKEPFNRILLLSIETVLPIFSLDIKTRKLLVDKS